MRPWPEVKRSRRCWILLKECQDREKVASSGWAIPFPGISPEGGGYPAHNHAREVTMRGVLFFVLLAVLLAPFSIVGAAPQPPAADSTSVLAVPAVIVRDYGPGENPALAGSSVAYEREGLIWVPDSSRHIASGHRPSMVTSPSGRRIASVYDSLMPDSGGAALLITSEVDGKWGYSIVAIDTSGAEKEAVMASYRDVVTVVEWQGYSVLYYGHEEPWTQGRTFWAYGPIPNSGWQPNAAAADPNSQAAAATGLELVRVEGDLPGGLREVRLVGSEVVTSTLLLPSQASAEGFSAAETVHVLTGGKGLDAEVCQDGRLNVVWQAPVFGVQQVLHVSKDDAAPWGLPVIIPEDMATAAIQPRMTCMGEGDVMVSWIQSGGVVETRYLQYPNYWTSVFSVAVDPDASTPTAEPDGRVCWISGGTSIRCAELGHPWITIVTGLQQAEDLEVRGEIFAWSSLMPDGRRHVFGPPNRLHLPLLMRQ
jgi:hypothetical protein